MSISMSLLRVCEIGYVVRNVALGISQQRIGGRLERPISQSNDQIQQSSTVASEMLLYSTLVLARATVSCLLALHEKMQ